MGSTNKDFISGIEFGTDKISVIHACVNEKGCIDVLSFASKPSKRAIVKGEIIDANEVINILNDLLKESEKGLSMNFDRTDRRVFFLVNGMYVCTRQGEGTVLTGSSSGKVTRKHMEEAMLAAQNIVLSSDMQQIQVFGSYFILDGRKRESSPMDKLAEKITAHAHVVFASKKQLDVIQKILREVGFERDGIPLFSPIASAYSLLTLDERMQGTLLFDFGAGVCSYALIHNDGVLLSGTIPVGVNNLANDLSLALDLPYDFCHTFIKESRLSRLHMENQNYLEYRTEQQVRRIPVASFEKVMDLRIREIFDLMQSILGQHKIYHNFCTSVVITGGGALIESAKQMMSDVTNLPVRVGTVQNLSGSLTSIRKESMPCYSAILGLVKEIGELDKEDSSGIDKLANAMGKFGEGLQNAFGTLLGALKI